MKKHLEIAFFLFFFLFSSELFPQKEENQVDMVSQDDLGNVEDAFQENFFEALKQKAIGNHDKAIAALHKCLAVEAKPVVFFELGKNYNALENYTKAIGYLEKARLEVPKNEAVLEELFTAYYQNREYKKAIPVVEELQKINSRFSEDLVNLYVLDQQFDRALQLLDKLDAKWGESDYRNGLRRKIYAQTNDVGAKIADLKTRIRENLKEEENYLNLIFVYSEAGNDEEAFATAKKLLEIRPNSELVHLALYKFYMDDKASEAAVRSIKIILKSELIDEATKSKVLNGFLEFAAQNPDLEEDLMEVVQLFSLDEGNAKVYGQLGNYFLESGKERQALNYFELGLENGATEFEIFTKTLLLRMKFEQFEAARELNQKSLENYPSQPLLYLIGGKILNQLKLFKEAEEKLSFGLSFLIGDPAMEADFYQQLSIAYSGLGNEKKATEFQQKSSELKNEKINEEI